MNEEDKHARIVILLVSDISYIISWIDLFQSCTQQTITKYASPKETFKCRPIRVLFILSPTCLSTENTKFSSVGTIISFILSYIFTTYIIKYISNFVGRDRVIYISKPTGLDFAVFFAACLFGVFNGVLPADDLHMSKHLVIR
jgi:hypothetical protein